MLTQSSPLRIFVAMPGDLGPRSRYSSAESVKKNLFDSIVERLTKDLNRPVELFIEKDKPTTGDIHASMFSEALSADIYFADLTNANPNVYLELGVRWALRDGLTIPIYQNTDDLRFNVGSSRAFLYTPDNINDRITTIVEMIKKFLAAPWDDSPIRDRLEIVSVQKVELENLKSEIRRLQEARGEELLKAANAAPNLEEKIALLKRAVETNPAYVPALIQLGITYRLASAYADSARALLAARRLDPVNALAHRELGITYSKSDQIEDAIGSLETAVDLDGKDGESWSNLGGAFRRKGVKHAPDEYDVVALQRSRECYSKAEELNPYDLYAALNVCRLDLLLAKWEPLKYETAVSGFTARLPLCQYEAQRNPNNPWLQFDLAEALLFAGRAQEAKSTYEHVLKAIPPDQLHDFLRSVSGPLEGYLKSGILRAALEDAVQDILALFSGKLAGSGHDQVTSANGRTRHSRTS